MKRKTWYAIVLVLPLLPLLFQSAKVEDMPILAMGVILVSGALIAGIPYLGFYIGVLVWMKTKTADEVKKASWWFPMIFAGIFSLCWLLFAVSQRTGVGDILISTLGLSGFCVIVGQLYVVLAHMLTWLMQKIGLVGD